MWHHTRQIGNAGEESASSFLSRIGFRNVRRPTKKNGYCDLLAELDGCEYFFEVKSTEESYLNNKKHMFSFYRKNFIPLLKHDTSFVVFIYSDRIGIKSARNINLNLQVDTPGYRYDGKDELPEQLTNNLKFTVTIVWSNISNSDIPKFRNIAKELGGHIDVSGEVNEGKVKV